MSARVAVILAGAFLFAGVAAGAFGAHALRARIAPDLLAVFETGVRYHLVHALGLLAVGLLALHWPDAARGLALCAWLMAAGIVLFSGSLYVLALSGWRAFGIVTPFGGAAWLASWALLVWIAWRQGAAA